MSDSRPNPSVFNGRLIQRKAEEETLQWSDGASKIINIVFYYCRSYKGARGTKRKRTFTHTHTAWKLNGRQVVCTKTQTIHSVRFVRVMLAFFIRSTSEYTNTLCITFQMNNKNHMYTDVNAHALSETRNICLAMWLSSPTK